MFIFPDPETPKLRFYKDGQEYKANLDYDLLWLIDHNFSLLL